MDNDSYLHVLERIHDGRDKPCNLPLPLLRSITEDFSGKRKIGHGGCGEVYKGFIPNGIAVAVKRLFNHRTVDEQLFLREVQSMMNVQHQNVVRLLGYCSNTEQIAMDVEGKYILADVRERLLCFEYVGNGSLENHLTDELRGHEWHTRYQIIRGICEGLLHLHKEKRIIHMDLKPANILLDNHMIPKIADFGLSRFDDTSRTMSTNRLLSLRYCAQEYLYDGKMSVKSDIYSLGIIIMELVTGSYNVNPNVTNILRRWSQRWKLSGKQPPLGYQQVRKCIELALTCVEKDPQARPFIWDIIAVLNQMENGEQEIPCLENMLGIDPLELHFPFELNKKKTCLLKLSNDSEDYIAFNIQLNTTLFSAQPDIGIVPPRSQCNVNITLEPLEEAPPQKHYANEFTVQSRRVDWGLTAKDISMNMFNNKDVVEMIDEVNLTVVFDEPLVVSSCSGDKRNQCEYCSSTQAHEEAPQVDIPCIDIPMNDDKVSTNKDNPGSDGKVSTNTTEKNSVNPSGEVNMKDASVSSPLDGKSKKDPQSNDLSRSSSANPSEDDAFASTGLVHVDPLALRYPFELNKKFDCSVKMSNRTDDHVAFKFKKNTNVDFLVVPNKKGILPPRSTQEFVITTVAHQESDMQEKGHIVVWSTIVSSKDALICEEIFRNTPGRVVQKVQLDVIYVAPALAQPSLWDEFMDSLVSAPLSLTYNGRQKDNNQQVEDKSKGSEGRTTQQVRRQEPSDQLLDVQPPELRYFFQPNKLMSCSLQLTNNSDEEVAFRFKEMNGRQQPRLRFASMPLQGIVAPKSTYTVIFITQKLQEPAQEENFDLVLQSGVLTEEPKLILKSDRSTHPFDCDASSVKVHEVTLKAVFADHAQQEKEITSGVTRSIIETELLDIYPELGCLGPNIIDLRFSNKTDDDVYFFIMPTNNNPAGENEMEGPLCRGSVMPRSTCRVNATMKQQACRILMTTSRSLQQLPYGIERLSDMRDRVFKSVKENGGKAHEVSLMVASNYETASNPASNRTQLKVDIPSCNLAKIASIDVHPTEPWIVTAHVDGNVCIWKISDHLQDDGYQCDPVTINTPEFSLYYRALSVKFVARMKWVVHGDNYGYISVHEYNTAQINQVTKFRAHLSAVRSLAVHPIHSYMLSASDDRMIKLWDWDNGWVCAREFRGHSGPVLQVKFNPKDTDTFASVSNLLGATETGRSASNLMDSADEHANIKIWSISSSRHIEDLRGRFSAVEYYLRRTTNQPCLAIGKEGGATEIWDLQKKGCAPQYFIEKAPLITGHAVTAIARHPTHPVLVTGTNLGSVYLWNSTKHRLEHVYWFPYGGVKGFGFINVEGYKRLVVAFDNKIESVEINSSILEEINIPHRNTHQRVVQ